MKPYKIAILAILAILAPILAQDTPSTDAVFTVTITGATLAADGQAARHAIALENERRLNLEGTPLPQLPTGTNAELKASYQETLALTLERIHQGFVARAAQAALEDEFRKRWLLSTDAQRQAAKDALSPLPAE